MKGQLGLETLITLSILAFFLLIILVFQAARTEDVDYANSYLEARKICFNLRNTADDVFSSGNGTRTNFTLPERLNNQKDYQITVDSSENIARLTWENKTYSCLILVNVTNKTHLYFEISKGENSAYNQEGSVVIEH